VIRKVWFSLCFHDFLILFFKGNIVYRKQPQFIPELTEEYCIRERDHKTVQKEKNFSGSQDFWLNSWQTQKIVPNENFLFKKMKRLDVRKRGSRKIDSRFRLEKPKSFRLPI